MQRWCRGLLLVLCSTVLTCNQVESTGEDNAYLIRKILTYFNLLDNNKDGTATASDFIALVVNAESQQTLDLRKTYDHQLVIAGQLFKYFPMTDETTPEFLVFGLKRQDFVQSILNRRTGSQLMEPIAQLMGSVYELLNYDDMKSHLSPYEWKVFWIVVGVDLATFDEAFAAMDTDGDGYIYIGEYIAAMFEYFTSNDPTLKSKWCFGPVQ